MIDPEDVAAAGFFTFVGSLLVLYGLLPLGESLSFVDTQTAFWAATATWLMMYANCGGYEWGTAESYHKALFVFSWVVLFAVAAQSYGVISFDVMAQIASLPYGTYAVVLAHTASAYFVWTGGGR